MTAGSPPNDALAVRIAGLLAAAPIIDGHNDLPYELGERESAGAPLDVANPTASFGLHTDLPRLRAGGVGAQYWSAYVPCDRPGQNPVTATFGQIDRIRRLVARYPGDLAFATSAEEVEQARASGKIASLIGLEGGHSIDNSLAVLRQMHALGARYLTLTHNSNTDWADSATDEPRFGGLSEFGREVVRECNRLGVMADMSHVAPATMHAALGASSAPAFFSHSSARALCDHPRNVPDDVLVRVADTAGVVMVTFVPGFLTEPCRAWFGELRNAEAQIEQLFPPFTDANRAQLQRWVAANPCPPCHSSDVADHIEHVRDVAGIDHVAIGGDFDGVMVTPVDLAGVDSYPRLLIELAVRGWSDSDLAKLTWSNALRVLRDTESAAAALGDQEPSLATIAQLDHTP